MGAIVQALNLCKAYALGDEPFLALNDVSLEVYPGEMVAITGRTGAGKSSLLHIVGCLQRPDSGRLLIEDQDISQLDDEDIPRFRAKKLGFLFQAFNLLPNETVLTNVAVPLWGIGLDEQEIHHRARESLRLVRMENRMYHNLSRIPERYRQRVAIARSVVNNPPVILADEPTWGLDSTAREEVMGLFQHLNKQGKTIVITTSEASVANYCRRVVKMVDGRAVEDKLVGRRRVIAPFRRGPGIDDGPAEEESVCPRCNFGNPKQEENCQRCKYILALTMEEEESIKDRLSAAPSRWIGVESPSDEGGTPAQEIVEELKKVPFLEGLGSKSLVKLIPVLERRTFQRGYPIVKQGDPADSYYIVRDGHVLVIVPRDEKSVAPVATLGPKEGFGEMALLTDQPQRSFTIVAETDAEVWRLPKEAFKELVSENLSLALYFNRLLSGRLKALQDMAYPQVIREVLPLAASAVEGRAPAERAAPGTLKPIKTGGKLILLEQVLVGGLPLESLTLIEGPTSTGKSVLSQHLVYGALLEGHGVAYFTLEHTSDSFNSQMDSMGLPVSNYVQNNQLVIHSISEPTGPGESERLLGELTEDIRRLPGIYSFIIVDDITGLASYSEGTDIIRLFSSIKDLCKDGETSVLVARTHAFDEQMLIRLDNLCDAHFSLRAGQLGAKLVNTIEVSKINNLKLRVGNLLSFEVETGLGIHILPTRQVRA